MAARPRLLILTPDYPPAPGGIQLVSERLAAGIERFQTRVSRGETPGAARFDESYGRPSCAGSASRRCPTPGRLALLNAYAVREALRFQPDLTLSMHSSPARPRQP